MEESKKDPARNKSKKSRAGTPDSAWYPVLCRGVRLFLRGRVSYRFETNGLSLPDGPALYVSNHPSSMDYFGLACQIWPRRVVPIANEYYFRKGLLKKLLLGIGVIPKKLFQDEGAVILKAKRTVKGGHSLYMAPEGRMSITGETYPIIASTGSFARFLGVPLVIVRLRGAYLNKPKWRPFFIKQTVRMELREVIPPEELKKMTPDEVNARICRGIENDEFAWAKESGTVFPKKNLLQGLPDLIYRCPACGALYALKAEDNVLRCGACGMELTAGEDYSFAENPYGFRNVADLYHALEAWELREGGPDLSCEVTVRRFRKEEEQRGSGTAKLNSEGFSFAGEVDGEPLSFAVSATMLKALPFSCGEEFETYFENDLYYFYPTEHREQCARWGLWGDLMSEALYALPGGGAEAENGGEAR